MTANHLTPTLTALFLCISAISLGCLIAVNDRLFSPILPFGPSASPTISVDPANIIKQMEIGHTFLINITVADITDLYVWQAGITFNPAVLEAMDFVEGSFLAENGTTLWTPGTINNTVGVISYYATVLAGNVTGVAGNGTLGTIIFKVRNYGNSTLQLTEVILLNSELENMEKTLIHGFIRVKIQGDVNGNDLVDVSDLNAIGKAYGSSPGSPNWNPEADINGDLIVNAADLTTYNGNYGKTT